MPRQPVPLGNPLGDLANWLGFNNPPRQLPPRNLGNQPAGVPMPPANPNLAGTTPPGLPMPPSQNLFTDATRWMPGWGQPLFGNAPTPAPTAPPVPPAGAGIGNFFGNGTASPPAPQAGIGNFLGSGAYPASWLGPNGQVMHGNESPYATGGGEEIDATTSSRITPAASALLNQFRPGGNTVTTPLGLDPASLARQSALLFNQASTQNPYATPPQTQFGEATGTTQGAPGASQYRNFLSDVYGLPAGTNMLAMRNDLSFAPTQVVPNQNPMTNMYAPNTVAFGQLNPSAMFRDHDQSRQTGTQQMNALGSLGTQAGTLGIESARQFGIGNTPGMIQQNAATTNNQLQLNNPSSALYSQAFAGSMNQGNTPAAAAQQVGGVITPPASLGVNPNPAGNALPGVPPVSQNSLEEVLNTVVRQPNSGVQMSPTGQPNLTQLSQTQLLPLMGNFILQAQQAGIRGPQLLAFMNARFGPQNVQAFRQQSQYFANVPGVNQFNQMTQGQ